MLLAADASVREGLLECKERPLFTKAQNLPPVKYGKNAVIKGLNLKEGATGIERNKMIGGHKG